MYISTWAQFHKAGKHKNLLSMKYASLIKTGLPTKFSFVAYCLILVFKCYSLNPENHVEIWLVILFLIRKKFHAKQIVVLTCFVKLGPGDEVIFVTSEVGSTLLINKQNKREFYRTSNYCLDFEKCADI